MNAKGLLRALVLCGFFVSGAALSQDAEVCADCSSKALSPHRSEVYLRKALGAETQESKMLWLSIALRFNPDNAEAKRLWAECRGNGLESQDTATDK